MYLAYDRKRESRVALKVLREVDPDRLYRFKQEFRAITEIQHPNLTRLHELLSDGAHWFFSMELIDGVDFLTFARNGAAPPSPDDAPTQILEASAKGVAATAPSRCAAPVNVERLRSSLRQFAEGLNALHAAGKLHRDIKPTNVLVTREDRVAILDFGLVKELAEDDPAQSDAIVGTPVYMSPEQMLHEDLGPASDWYSAGVMLYEALTGAEPFGGSARLRDKLRGDVRPPAELNPSTPADLNALCVALLQRHPALRPSGDEIRRRLGDVRLAPPSPSRSPQRATGFVGRTEYLKLLAGAFEASQRGCAVTVLVDGASGIGKSALVNHFLRELRQRYADVVTLSGRCFERESVPYKGLDGLVDALSRYLQRLPDSEQQALLPRDMLALARLFPVLRQASAVASLRHRGPELVDFREVRRRGFAAFRELLARLAVSRPAVLFVDDLHWSDLDSTALMEEALRAPGPELLFIATYRTEEAATSPALRAFLEGCRAAGQDVRELPVREMAPDEVGALVRILSREGAGPLPAAEEIATETGGNPFFVGQIVRVRESMRGEAGTRGAAPASLDSVLGAQLAGLPPTARQIAELLAAAGGPVDRSILIRAAAVRDYAEALDTLRDERLVRMRSGSEDERVELYHAHVADSVCRRMSPVVLAERHRALGDALESWGRCDPETLFSHFDAAGDRTRAARYAVEAAAQAWDALAFDRAARLYRAAIDRNATGIRSLLVRLGDSLVNTGRGKDAAHAYLEAAQSSTPGEGIELRRRAFEHLLRSGHINEGLAVMTAVLASLHEKMPESPRAAMLSVVWRRLWIKARGLGFRERDAQSIPSLELIRVDACGAAALGLGIVDNIRGADFQARHLLLALRCGELNRVARALSLEVAFNAYSGGSRRAETEALRLRTQKIVDRLDSPLAAGMLLLTSGLSAYLYGEWRQAVDYMHQAETILVERCAGIQQELDSVRNFLLRSYVWLGELNVLRRRLPELLKDAHERGDLYAGTMLGLRNSYMPLLAGDDAAAARQATQSALDAWPQKGFRTPHYIFLVVATDIDLYAGDAATAWTRLDESWRPLKKSLILRWQSARVESSYARGRCALAMAANATAADVEKYLDRAAADAAALEKEAMPWSLALAPLIRAGIAAHRGDRAEGSRLLGRAAADLDACGMAMHAAAARIQSGDPAAVALGHQWMRDQEIVRPERLAAMLAPGPWITPERAD